MIRTAVVAGSGNVRFAFLFPTRDRMVRSTRYLPPSTVTGNGGEQVRARDFIGERPDGATATRESLPRSRRGYRGPCSRESCFPRGTLSLEVNEPPQETATTRPVWGRLA